MDPIARTSGGRVSGLVRDGVTVFRGIPFAAVPDGPLRFQPPGPPAGWDGVRDATSFGGAPPQLAPRPGAPSVWRASDGLDCLTLNVWTPDLGAAGLPVMVWIYGGAWKTGASAMPGYEATKLAHAGVVVVTFNYRLGFEGFGHLPDVPDNRGLRDQIKALEWVRDNIAGFGGDPGDVTVFGESAGAASAAVLLTAPAARGLFRRAIAQSVPAGFRTPEEAGRITGLLAAAASVPPTWEGFAELPPEEILRVQDEPLKSIGPGLSAFVPVVDGDLITAPPWEALKGGAARDIELICGFTHEEYRLFTADRPPPDTTRTAPEVLHAEAAVAASFGLRDDAVDAYRTGYPGGDVFVLMLSDALFRMPSTWVAEAHARAGGRTWLYDFAWRSPGFGACHSLDVPFTFGNFDSPAAARLLGSPPPDDFEALSGRIRTAWTTFAATGDPGWPRYDLDHRRTRIWDTVPSDADDPLAVSRHVWEHLGPA